MLLSITSPNHNRQNGEPPQYSVITTVCTVDELFDECEEPVGIMRQYLDNQQTVTAHRYADMREDIVHAT